MKPIVVEISAEPVIAGRSGTNDRGAFTIPAKQNAYLHMGAVYPTKTEVIVPDTGPYRPGMYLLAGPMFKVGDYGRLSVDDRAIQLVAVDDAIAALKLPLGKAA